MATYLIGCGVVGRAIAEAHLAAGEPFWLGDINPAALDNWAAEVGPLYDLNLASPTPAGTGNAAGIDMPMLRVAFRGRQRVASASDALDQESPDFVIESIFEQRAAKRRLLSQLQQALGVQAVLCSNTSTIPIAELTVGLQAPQQVCGMHFFMPVERRPLVEIIRPESASAAVIEAAKGHAERLRKPTLEVADTPGFVVNRLLAPYLNEAMRLVQAGVGAEQLERVATELGMPMSPLELIDWIGTRTAFDAGRVYWQAFPQRMEPVALLAGMVKAKRTGRPAGGFYDYAWASDAARRAVPAGDGWQRSRGLAVETAAIVSRYQQHARSWSDEEVMWHLFLPMRIEAELILEAGTVTRPKELDQALRGGLGFQREAGFWQLSEQLGRGRCAAALTARLDQCAFRAGATLRDRWLGASSSDSA